MSQHREIIDSCLPEGPAWDVKTDDGMDNLFDGIALNYDQLKEELSKIGDLRRAFKTTSLDDLEKEYGIKKNTSLSDSVRREKLFNIQTDNTGDGTDDLLQKRLDNAGFNVNVYRNCPVVNPELVRKRNTVVMGAPDAIMGSKDINGDYLIIMGLGAGEIIVNGTLFMQYPAYTLVLGASPTVPMGGKNILGDFNVNMGSFLGNKQKEVQYFIPSESGYWPLIFFVGGQAVFNIDGSINYIIKANVDSDRREELKNLIVKYKPIYSWCVLIVNYI